MIGSGMEHSMPLADLETPALLLDRGRVAANIARMNAALKPHGVDLRPHLTTPAPLPPSTTTHVVDGTEIVGDWPRFSGW